MRIIIRLALVLLLLGGTFSLATDELQDSIAALGSLDSAAYDKAVKFLNKHRQEAEPSLLAVFRDVNKPPLARLRAVKLLGDFGDKGATGDIQQALDSGSESNAAIRVEMVRSLSKLGNDASLIDYLNKHRDDSPPVNAAIAISLQGKTDDDSKKALGYLLRNGDTRVFQSALRAASKTYEVSSKDAPAKESRPEFQGTTPEEKLAPTPGDLAILQALQTQQSSTNPQISQQAADFLDKLSQLYK